MENISVSASSAPTGGPNIIPPSTSPILLGPGSASITEASETGQTPSVTSANPPLPTGGHPTPSSGLLPNALPTPRLKNYTTPIQAVLSNARIQFLVLAMLTGQYFYHIPTTTDELLLLLQTYARDAIAQALLNTPYTLDVDSDIFTVIFSVFKDVRNKGKKSTRKIIESSFQMNLIDGEYIGMGYTQAQVNKLKATKLLALDMPYTDAVDENGNPGRWNHPACFETVYAFLYLSKVGFTPAQLALLTPWPFSLIAFGHLLVGHCIKEFQSTGVWVAMKLEPEKTLIKRFAKLEAGMKTAIDDPYWGPIMLQTQQAWTKKALERQVGEKEMYEKSYPTPVLPSSSAPCLPIPSSSMALPAPENSTSSGAASHQSHANPAPYSEQLHTFQLTASIPFNGPALATEYQAEFAEWSQIYGPQAPDE